MAIIIRAKNVGARRPIARVGDFHTCPKTTNDHHHKGGPVLTGSNLLQDQGKSIARIGDKAHCQGATDTIKTGVDSITLNGKPIATLSDAFEHGGTLVEGSSTIYVEETLGSIPPDS